MIIQCKTVTYFNAEAQRRRVRRGSWSEKLEFRVGVGEWWGVFSHKEQEKQEVSVVGVQSWSWRAKLAVERKSERADTAYSPRLREEELSDADNKRN